jgi:thiol-disulfide isomerase/thioredoxin
VTSLCFHQTKEDIMSGKSHSRIVFLNLFALAAVFAVPFVSLAGEFPEDWFYRVDPSRRAKLDEAVGKPLPALELTDWLNDKKPETEGKIVVIDLWATWCGPCISAIPHTNEVAKKYADQGVVVVGVCSSSRGQESMETVAEKYGMEYATAKDPGSAFAKKMGLQFYPTYAVADRKGVVRAIGLIPPAVDKVVEKLIEEPLEDIAKASDDAEPEDAAAKAPADTVVDAAWREGDAGTRARLEGLEGQAPPPLKLTNWINAEPMTLESLKGKVVMLDFWATWCGPCLSAVPHTNELMEKYGDQGLQIIGVCSSNGAEKMADTVKRYKIKYPVAADVGRHTVDAYRVNGYPDYYFIDRFGKLRIADCANGSIDKAIEALLAEQVAAE